VSYSFEIDTAAARKVRKLSPEKKALVNQKLVELLQNPRPPSGVRLRGGGGNEGWRVRVGKLRILYWIDEDRRTVVVYDIDVRQRVYKDLS
jgi:mRNA interferase RelE/StbE